MLNSICALLAYIVFDIPSVDKWGPVKNKNEKENNRLNMAVKHGGEEL